MAQIETWLECDLKKPVVVRQLTGNVFLADAQGNIVGVKVTNNGEDVVLSGSVMGYIIRADGATVAVNGTVSGNRASIVLPQSAYTVVGPISIAIRLVTNGVKTVLGACTGYVYRTTTDTIVDPDHVIPSLEELLEKIDDCDRAATAATAAANSANTAASTANTAASNADAKAALANTAAGTANTAAQNANTKAGQADTAAQNANTKAGLANTAAETANAAALKIDGMTAEAQTSAPGTRASASVSEVSGHKHIDFTIPRGDTGNGIANAVLNADYTLTINWTDGSAYTTPVPIRGAAGEDGHDGRDAAVIELGAIEYSFQIDSNGHLILHYGGDQAPNFYIDTTTGHLKYIIN